MEKAKALNNQSYIKVVLFLMLEVLAVTAFSLGNSFIFQSIIILILAILASVISFVEYKKEQFTHFLFFLFPLFMFGLLSALSNFTVDSDYVLGKNIFPNLFISFGLSGFALSGYLLASHKELKISKVIFAIYCALAAYVFINFVATMVQFEPFYTLKYKNYHVYYDGQMNPTPVGSMAYALMGFSFQEVSVQYYSFFTNILLSSSLGLLFVKYKDNKKEFISYIVFASLAIISLVVTINRYSVLFTAGEVVVLLAIFLIYKFKNKINFKILKIILFVFLGLVGIYLLIMILNAQYWFSKPLGIRATIEGNSFLNKLFNTNYFARRINPLLDGIFDFKTKTYGYVTMSSYELPFEYSEGMYPIGSWFFDSFLTSGLFGTILLTVFIIFGLSKFSKYIKNSDDEWKNKILIAGFVLSVIIFGLYGYDSNPYIYSDQLSPITLNGLFSIMIFLLGYCFFRSYKNKEKQVEEDHKEEEKYEEEIVL